MLSLLDPTAFSDSKYSECATFFLALQGMYSPAPIMEIKSVIKSFCHCALYLMERQSKDIICEGGNTETAVLEANYLSTFQDKYMLYSVCSIWKRFE